MGSIPARRRTCEKRPSAPTVSAARTLPAVLRNVTHAANNAVFHNEPLHLGVHDDAELKIFRSLGGDEFEETRLWKQEDAGESGLQPPEIERMEGAIGKLQCGAGDGGVREFVKSVCQADLIEDFQGRRMNGVASEFTVEVFVHFEERHGNTPARQKQGEHRAAADDAAGSLLNVADFFSGGFRLRSERDIHVDNPLINRFVAAPGGAAHSNGGNSNSGRPSWEEPIAVKPSCKRIPSDK